MTQKNRTGFCELQIGCCLFLHLQGDCEKGDVQRSSPILLQKHQLKPEVIEHMQQATNSKDSRHENILNRGVVCTDLYWEYR